MKHNNTGFSLFTQKANTFQTIEYWIPFLKEAKLLNMPFGKHKHNLTPVGFSYENETC